MARQNVAREISHAVGAQAEAAQVAGNHLLGNARVCHLPKHAQLASGARIARQNVSDGGSIRFVLYKDRQTTCLRCEQLASTQITRVVARCLRWRMSNPSKGQRRRHLEPPFRCLAAKNFIMISD